MWETTMLTILLLLMLFDIGPPPLAPTPAQISSWAQKGVVLVGEVEKVQCLGLPIPRDPQRVSGEGLLRDLSCFGRLVTVRVAEILGGKEQAAPIGKTLKL